MTKRAKPAKRPRAKKVVRNPMARALAGGLFRKRVVKPVGAYQRRPKHPKTTDETS